MKKLFELVKEARSYGSSRLDDAYFSVRNGQKKVALAFLSVILRDGGEDELVCSCAREMVEELELL